MTKTADITQTWIEQLRNGSEYAARQVYGQYSKAMYNTLIRITADHEVAQDLLQESFVKAFQKIKTYRGDATFGAWLKRIVINTGLAYVRKQKWHTEELDETMDVGEEETIDLPPMHIIQEAIEELPDRSRLVFNLFLLEGYSHEQIANELGISISTSKTQYMRAKALLRSTLKTKIYG